MTERDPTTVLDGRFSEAGVGATPWSDVVEVLDAAEIFWLSTVRRDGQPHITPLLALWHDGRLLFGTGPDEQKARNLGRNPRCALTTGANRLREGLDVVVEGSAVRVSDPDRLRRIADRWVAKYPDWRFEPNGDVLSHHGGDVLVFEVVASGAFAFGRGPYRQTSYRF